MADGKLSAVGAKSRKIPGLYSDGGGLYLKVTLKGKSWVFRYKTAGVEHRMGLGRFEEDLAEARERARECRKQVQNGIDPLTARRDKVAQEAAERVAEAAARTFRVVAAEYSEAQKLGWKNAKHGDQWSNTLRDYAYPLIGDTPVADVTVEHLKKNPGADLDHENRNGVSGPRAD